MQHVDLDKPVVFIEAPTSPTSPRSPCSPTSPVAGARARCSQAANKLQLIALGGLSVYAFMLWRSQTTAQLAPEPVAKPAAKPVAEPAAEPAAKPTTKPIDAPAARHAARPAADRVQTATNRLPVPLSGVNVGGWLCLEDWFFSGSTGRSVMTTDPAGQGACLPPVVPGWLAEPWPSEGILAQRLAETRSAQVAADVFRAHRASFIGDSDWRDMASLGIKHVRVPITWAAFADALKPLDAKAFASHNPETDTVIVPDPLYPSTTSFATVPRAWLRQLLLKARANGLKLLLDLHAFPGGAADGTYNGVWPQKPGFWDSNASMGEAGVALTEIGIWVAEAMVEWLESLDAESLDGLHGVTFMNEPAHMAAFEAMDKEKAFIRSEAEVLSWLAATADRFRHSALPGMGKKLYLQVIDTAFKNFTGTVVPWFHSTFSADEHAKWAVVDQHYYAAWSPGCSGRTVKGGAYFCDAPLDTIRSIVRGCATGFAANFAAEFPGLKASTEFSVGTYEDARFACNDQSVLSAFLEEQVATFTEHDIEPFFWTWRMPYGQVFEPGWSLKRLAGMEGRSAEVCESSSGSSSHGEWV